MTREDFARFEALVGAAGVARLGLSPSQLRALRKGRRIDGEGRIALAMAAVASGARPWPATALAPQPKAPAKAVPANG